MSGTMTEARTQADAPDGEAGGPALHRTGGHRRRRRAVRVFSVVTVLGLVGFGWLAVVGKDAALQVKGGTIDEIVTDPAAPGYVAAVDPSPVHLVALTDADDALSAFYVVVPDPAGGSGTVIWSLGELVVEVEGAPTALTDVYKSGGLEAARAEFEKVLGFGATDAVAVTPADLAAAAAPYGSITVKNPDSVQVESKGKRTTKYASGNIDLEPADLADYLTIRGAGEAPENRSTRASVLIAALADRLSGSEGTATTGGSSSSAASTSADTGPDLATAIASLGATQPDFVVLPTERQSFKGSYLYSPDTAEIANTLAGIVQFPVSAFPGQRPRVRVLNGTTDTSVASSVAPDLAAAGGEVMLVGNAESLDAAATSVVYSDDAFKDVAERIAEIVGVQAERTDDPTDAADIDVVLGPDQTG